MKKIWNWIKSPSKMALGSILLIGIIIGIFFLISFNKTLELTSTEEFCISCHEMQKNSYQEYLRSPHFNNASGVKVTCKDCHVPNDLLPEMLRHMQAANEVYGSLKGIIDTPKKYEEHRAAMAQKEWARMKANDSAECRRCHSQQNMDFSKQSPSARKIHKQAKQDNKTCIDCHQGIAHKLPQNLAVSKDI